jgi:hypothetical protein
MSVEGKNVEVILDLRQTSYGFPGPEAFLGLWQRAEAALAGKALMPSTRLSVPIPGVGDVGVEILAVPGGQPVVVTADTPFAIHSLLEPPPPDQRCRLCVRDGRRTPGALRCALCKRDSQICEEHAVLVAGSLKAFCLEHAPACGCGEPAAAVCRGPRCEPEGGRMFCRPHLVAHPNIPDVAYCSACYTALFPPCSVSGCDGIGGIECLHVDPSTEEPCRRRLCPRHAHRWQVFGPHRIGLGRCDAHSALRTLDDVTVIFQVVAGTALLRAREKPERRGRIHLPTLPAVRHILMKSRNRLYEVADVNRFFDLLEEKLQAQTPLRQSMRGLVDENREARSRAIAKHEDEKGAGRQIFARIQNELRDMDLDEVAASLVFTDYRPARGGKGSRPGGAPAPQPELAGILFVRLEPALRGLLIGRGGNTIKELQRRVRVKISFEREDESR